ncbi:MAG TPA: translation initiation factor IF-2 N-terminal domain-containing protein, partial [Beijerinckiaceae bacterium]|nr:translation initiation factor IF-2 N-terminal domain-containing protein [Beijerinckiaceae bacterium]
MSDTKTPGDKTLHVSSSKTLTLKRPVEQGMVRQSFSHGRSKAVVVEKVKRRVVGPGEAKEAPAPAAKAAPAAPAAAKAAAAPAPAGRPAQPQAAAARPTGMVLRTLSEQERDARTNALADARVREGEDRRRAEEETKRRADRDAREAREREASEARKREEDERRHKEDERKRRAEDEARRRLGEEAPPPRGAAGPRAAPGDVRRPRSLDHMGRPATETTASPAGARPAGAVARAPGRPVEAEDEAETKRIIRRPGMPMKIITPPKTPKAPGGDRNRGRLTISTATGGEDERTRSVASFRRRMQRLTGNRNAEPKEKLAREVVIPETITIQELANRMSERGVDVIRLLMKQGQLLKITDAIDADTAQLVAEELGHTVKRVAESDVEEGLFDTPDV